MSKYVRGVKRNQIIQRWLQGIEDPEYEVFPTKKEGKYIVKLRANKLDDTTFGETKPQEEKANDVEPVDTTYSTIIKGNFAQQNAEETSSVKSVEQEPTPIVRQNKPRSSSITRSSDSTINLEILEQLRNLGEEIRNDRFKKEQKQFIKQIVNKEINKSRIRSKYVPDIFPDNESVDSTREVPNVKDKPVEESIQKPETPVFRSRIRR